MTVNSLYILHPKKARFESVFKQNPMYNNRVLCGFVQYLGYGVVNFCYSGNDSYVVRVSTQVHYSGRGCVL